MKTQFAADAVSKPAVLRDYSERKVKVIAPDIAKVALEPETWKPTSFVLWIW